MSAVVRKANESAALIATFFAEHADAIDVAAKEIAGRLGLGGRLITLGNGGSACDAMHVAVEFAHPILEKRRAFPAFSLTGEAALLTAIGNDGDFAQVFEAQVALHASAPDIVLGISTSGTSTNTLRALRRARAIGALTIGFCGRDGGPLVDHCDHCFIVPSWSIHRIQEVHTVLLHVLWDHVHLALGEPDVL